MRNLTIKREKSFVGSLVKLKVYIEEPIGDIDINNIRYTKIGELKNGEEKTFLIENIAKNVAVIADTASRNICNDVFRIPAGEEDIYLSGRNIFNPATGNAFRFNGVSDENILKNRKQNLIKGIVILCFFIILGVVVGLLTSGLLFNSSTGKAKKFSKDGMTITLTDRFHEVKSNGFTACYESEEAAVFALKESFSLAQDLDKLSLEEYGNLVISNNRFDSNIKVKKDNGLTYFEYESKVSGSNETYKYFSAVYKTSDSFWLIQFATYDKDYNDNIDNIIDWAKNIKFAG